MDDPPPPATGNSLSRRELQSYLKKWNRKAIGTTELLRETYEKARKELYCGTDELPDSKSGIESSTVIASIVTAQHPETKVTAVQKKNKQSHPRKKEEAEKRVKRYRSKPTIGILQRIDRAKTQRLYLVERSDVIHNESLSCEFVILGSTGNVYTVQICQIPSCTCPDHAKGNLCKHILFVLLKVVGLDSRSPLIYQAALLKSELQEVFSLLSSRRVGGSVMANEKVKKSYASLKSGGDGDDDGDDAMDDDLKVKRKSLEADSDCPICFDPLVMDGQSNICKLAFCRATCGTNFHADCIKKWLKQLGRNATCPNCRQPWEEETTKTEQEEYTNLGSLQGLSKRRDYSTYSSFYKRRRWY